MSAVTAALSFRLLILLSAYAAEAGSMWLASPSIIVYSLLNGLLPDFGDLPLNLVRTSIVWSSPELPYDKGMTWIGFDFFVEIYSSINSSYSVSEYLMILCLYPSSYWSILSKLELCLVSSRVDSESSNLVLVLGLITAQLNTTPISLRNLLSNGRF